jgi:hypothetical protein
VLERRDCPTTLTPAFPGNISQLRDNQTDETVAISPVEYDTVNHFRHVFVASTSWHGNYDGGSYYSGGSAPYLTNGLFYWYGHMDSSGNVTQDGRGIMATGTDDHEPGYGLPAAGHYPHATFDQFGNLFLAYMTDKVQFRGVGSLPRMGNTLTDLSANWFPNEWVNKEIWVANRTFLITANDAHTLTFSGFWQYYRTQNWFYQIVSRGSSFQNVEVVQSIDGGSFTWQLDGPPLGHPQNFTWLASYNDIASGPYGPLQPIVATGPGFGTQLDSGSTTGGNSTTTLNDTSKSWTPNQFAGDLVAITSGIGQHQAALITSNTATQLTITPTWGITPDYDPITPSNTSQYAIGTKIGSLWLGFEYTNGNPDAFGAPVYGFGLGSPSVGSFGPEITLPSQSHTYITVSGFAVGPAGQIMTTWLTQKYGNGEQPPKARIFTATASGLIDTQFNDPISPPEHPAALVNLPMDGTTIPAESPGIMDAAPHVAYDNDPASSHYGRAYLVYDDVPDSVIQLYPNDVNIYAKYSDANGLVYPDGTGSWSAANGENPVNDDGGHTSQFWPQLAVDPITGNLALTWYDARVDPANNTLVSLYGAVSTDGANTFSSNQRISPSAPLHAPPPPSEPQARTNGPITDLQGLGTITGVSGTNLTDSNQHWIPGWWHDWTRPDGMLIELFAVTAPSPFAGTGMTYAGIANNSPTTLSLVDKFGPPDYAWSNGIPTIGSPYWIEARGIFDQDLGRYTGLAYYNGAFYAAWSDNSNSTDDNPDINLYNNWTLDVYFTKVTVTTSPGGGMAPSIFGGGTTTQPRTGGLAAARLASGSPTTIMLPLVAELSLLLGPSLLWTTAPPAMGDSSPASLPAAGDLSLAAGAMSPAPDRSQRARAVDLLFALGDQRRSFTLGVSPSHGSANTDSLGETSLLPDWASFAASSLFS